MTMTRISLLKSLSRDRRLFARSCLSCSSFLLPIKTCVLPQSSAFGRQRPFSSSASQYVSWDDDPILTEKPALVSLDHVELRYADSKSTVALDLQLQHPEKGGHVVLAPNGSGKSLISNALAQGFQQHRAKLRKQQQQSNSQSNLQSQGLDEEQAADLFQKGSMELDDGHWHGQAMAHVSFESHEQLLAIRDDHGQPVSVQKAISSGGNLNKAAQFLIVRFGMYPLLHRTVDTLSTGEIRKTLLIRALANRPRLLVLDNAFDGLDVPSRDSLKDLVTKTLQGFRPDILVQGVDAKATAHTQVVLITHRAEEIVDPISALTYYDESKQKWISEERGRRTGEQLLQQALGMSDSSPLRIEDAWNDPNLPSIDEVANWWQQSTHDHLPIEESVVEMKELHIQRGDATLLSDLSWNVKPGQHWWIAGGNGAGKSTLSRLLAREETGLAKGSLQVNTSHTATEGQRRNGVGWVSTESHMALARSPQTVKEVVTQHSTQHGTISLAQAARALEWLDMPSDQKFLQRPFAQLSQGEQKCVLIAAAIASRPQVLVLDEPCQGLDSIKRQRVLGVVERLCEATGDELSLIYITHHPEEVLPSIDHVLHLAKGRDVYQGSRDDYNPAAVAAEAEKLNNASKSSPPGNAGAKRTLH